MKDKKEVAQESSVMLGTEKIVIKRKLRRRDTDYDDVKKCTIPRNTARMLSIDKTKDIFNLAIDDVKEQYTVGRAIGFLEAYESEWGRFPKEGVEIATRSAEKLSYAWLKGNNSYNNNNKAVSSVKLFNLNKVY